MHPLVQSILDTHLRVSLEEFVDAFSSEIPLLRDLEDTPQDVLWHSEGNVAVHTQMVLEEVYRILEDPPHGVSFLPYERLILILSAIFHDIAKPLTTRVQSIHGEDRITAPRHSWRGRSILASQAHCLGLTTPWRLEFLQLVGYHHEPKFLLIREKPVCSFYALSRASSIKLLYALELADMRGRRCADRETQIEWIEMFRLYAEEYCIFERPSYMDVWSREIREGLCAFDNRVKAFGYLQGLRDLESGTITHPSEAVARTYSFAQKKIPHVVALCGLSGSGKSTWISSHPEYASYVYISLDQIREELTGHASDQSENPRVHNVARERLKDALRARKDVVWDATNLRRDFRQNVLATGMDYGALTTLVVFQIPYSHIKSRNASRDRRVPPHVLNRQIDTFQWPTIDECHRIVYIDEHGQEHPYSHRYTSLDV